MVALSRRGRSCARWGYAGLSLLLRPAQRRAGLVLASLVLWSTVSIGALHLMTLGARQMRHDIQLDMDASAGHDLATHPRSADDHGASVQRSTARSRG